ncbi:hypothetical protein MP638_003385 [Amoeboaphelidium occidentale]|nr:hypothetical protein MP638_003385 [Amoeboaphelidium occidentale]
MNQKASQQEQPGPSAPPLAPPPVYEELPSAMPQWQPQTQPPPVPQRVQPQPLQVYAMPSQPPQQPLPRPPAPPQQQQQDIRPQQTQIVVTTLSDFPCTLVCPFCKATVTTRTKKQAGGCAWLLCSLLCIFGCWMGCCLIPFCADDCLDTVHDCPRCNRTILVKQRL